MTAPPTPPVIMASKMVESKGGRFPAARVKARLVIWEKKMIKSEFNRLCSRFLLDINELLVKTLIVLK